MKEQEGKESKHERTRDNSHDDKGKSNEATFADDTWLGSRKGKGLKRATRCSWVGGNGLTCEQGWSGLEGDPCHGTIHEGRWGCEIPV